MLADFFSRAGDSVTPSRRGTRASDRAAMQFMDPSTSDQRRSRGATPLLPHLGTRLHTRGLKGFMSIHPMRSIHTESTCNVRDDDPWRTFSKALSTWGHAGPLLLVASGLALRARSLRSRFRCVCVVFLCMS